MCIWCGNHAVEESFGNKHFHCGGGNLTGVVDLVPVDSEMGAIHLGFLRMYCAYKTALCYILFVVAWDMGFGDEMDCVGRLFNVTFNALGKAAKLTGR